MHCFPDAVIDVRRCLVIWGNERLDAGPSLPPPPPPPPSPPSLSLTRVGWRSPPLSTTAGGPSPFGVGGGTAGSPARSFPFQSQPHECGCGGRRCGEGGAARE